jgi:hypothetical protein
VAFGRRGTGGRVDVGQRDLVGVADEHLCLRIAKGVPQDDRVLLAVVDQRRIRGKRAMHVGQVDGERALITWERAARFFRGDHLAIGPDDAGG